MNKNKRYETNSEFLEFLNTEFNKTATNATVEELTEFAFGDFDCAVEAFIRYKNK